MQTLKIYFYSEDLQRCYWASSLEGNIFLIELV